MVNELFTRAEVAYIFKVSKGTVRLWEKKGLISTASIEGKRPRYAVTELERLQTNVKPRTEEKK